MPICSGRGATQGSNSLRLSCAANVPWTSSLPLAGLHVTSITAFASAAYEGFCNPSTIPREPWGVATICHVTVRAVGALLAQLPAGFRTGSREGPVKSLIDSVIPHADAEAAPESSRTLRSRRHSKTYVNETPRQAWLSSHSACQN